MSEISVFCNYLTRPYPKVRLLLHIAEVVKLVDTHALGACGGNSMPVRVRPRYQTDEYQKGANNAHITG